MELDNRALGQRIRGQREKLGLSREDMAEIVGLSVYYVGQLERGERQMSLPVLVALASCLHVSLDYLVLGKKVVGDNYVKDAPGSYTAGDVENQELSELLARCSPREIELIGKIVKVIIPYSGK